jgi:hypothetical protein
LFGYLETSLAESVVNLPLLVIAQHLIRIGDLLELVLRARFLNGLHSNPADIKGHTQRDAFVILAFEKLIGAYLVDVGMKLAS